MPWQNPALSSQIKAMKTLIEKQFKIWPTATIWTCTKEELISATLAELHNQNYSEREIEQAKLFFPFMVGKYFRASDEVWLVERYGGTITTLLHELLHSIQNCSPNREDIIDFICYRLLEEAQLDEFTLKDWLEIEREVGFQTIKKRLLQEGDCEEFSSIM